MELEDRHPSKGYGSSCRRDVEDRTPVGARYLKAQSNLVSLLDPVFGGHFRIRKCRPKCFVIPLHTLQARIHTSVSMQDDVLGVKVKITWPPCWIGETFDRAMQDFPI